MTTMTEALAQHYAGVVLENQVRGASVPLVPTPSFPPKCECVAFVAAAADVIAATAHARVICALFACRAFVFLLTERVSRSFVVARSRAELGELPVGQGAMDGAAV
jgi:hypothetical protein